MVSTQQFLGFESHAVGIHGLLAILHAGGYSNFISAHETSQGCMINEE
jgi:hypothetical protein